MLSDGLYAIVDVDAWQRAGIAVAEPSMLESIAEAVLAASPVALQLRAKNATARETLSLLRRLRPLCSRQGVPLVANDRADLAVLANVDVLHVGQDDLDAPAVRIAAPGMPFGISTHDSAQMQAALAERPNYVAFGPVFGTKSKEAPDPTTGLAAFTHARGLAEAAGVPCVAIGGIDNEGAARLASAGGHLAAVISALVVAENGRPALARITEAARALCQALGARAS